MKIQKSNYRTCTFTLISIFIFHFFSFQSTAQKNLVQNPSFEESIPTSPTKNYNHNQNPNVQLVDGWVVPTMGTSDYYNSDKSTIRGVSLKKARSGQGRIGIILKTKKITEYTEYTETRLLQPLEEDKKYFVKLHFCLDKRSTNYAQSIGICFSKENLYSNTTTTLPALSQITCTDPDNLSTQNGWVELSGIYEAKGGEQFLTIGNFDTRPSLPIKNTIDQNNLSDLDLDSPFKDYCYYYIDDVCVQEIIDSTNHNCCTNSIPTNTEKSFNNFVFMVDISSSMIKDGYLEQVKKSVINFVDTLGKNDLVSILTFDGNTYVLLKKIKASEKTMIEETIQKIVAGSSTNIDKAVSTAYYIMDSSIIPEGNNRIILASDAIFKLSKKSRKTIKHYYKKKDVAFTMVQFGHQHNAALEKICKKTEGNYANAKNQQIERVLSNQIEQPVANEYTRERKGLRFFGKLFRIFLVASIIAIFILVKEKK